MKCTGILLMFLAVAGICAAGEDPVPRPDNGGLVFGGGRDLAKAVGDTIVLMGPGGSYRGDFEDATKAIKSSLPPGWNSVDNTAPQGPHWNISSVNDDKPGMDGLTAWCGEMIPSCGVGDPDWGYGDSWTDWLEFRFTVPDPDAAYTVDLDFDLAWDTEPGYDFVILSRVHQAGETDLQFYDGIGSVTGAGAGFGYSPGEYVGGNQIVIRWAFESDAGWSDEDCSWPTSGAANLDDIQVVIAEGEMIVYQGTASFDGGNWDEGWAPGDPPLGVGDFAAVWEGLEDIDPCASNYSKALAFLDDGTVTGEDPYPCQTWCYGPNGYVVHPEGGRLGPSYHLENYVETPVMIWPDPACDGITFSFDFYSHETLSGDSPGMFVVFGVRSATAAQDIADQPYLDRNFFYFGDGIWARRTFPVSDLMEPGRTQVQCMVGVYELPWVWAPVIPDPTPAPYFDNLRVDIYPISGPVITAQEIHLANDGFYESGVFDDVDLGRNNVRFDMAGSVALTGSGGNDPGDSIVVNIEAVRAGAELAGMPVLHWTVAKNPTFPDAVRPNMPPGAGVVSGSVPGYNAVKGSFIPSEVRFAFDLPDSGFLFPGDVLHYYIEAADEVGGDVQTSTLPADLSGFGDFGHPHLYDSRFVVHALPTLRDDGFGGVNQNRVLFWDDSGNHEGEDEWYWAFKYITMKENVEYDIFRTRDPLYGAGNGLGGRVGAEGLFGYDFIVYTSGDLARHTLGNGDAGEDPSDDVAVLTAWLDQGDKGLFLTGDNLAADLSDPNDVQGNAFVQDCMGLVFVTDDVRPIINMQSTPTVQAVPGNGAIVGVDEWVAYGGCPGINTFDGVEAGPSAQRLAEFLDPGGNPAYSFSAATLNQVGTSGSLVVSMPYDFTTIYEAKGLVTEPARAAILEDVLNLVAMFRPPWYDPSAVPEAGSFAVRCGPNPFNPRTKIDYTVPGPGRMSLKVYDLRGERVRTLIDGRVSGSGHVVWDGTADSGSTAASGVYFYETRYEDQVKVGRMTLVR